MLLSRKQIALCPLEIVSSYYFLAFCTKTKSQIKIFFKCSSSET
uniref:Uncharacterized protein n=1 Tax=Anguilla anguilla TaxID=7936 RepID=A0A0E9W4G2_ANGAN